MSILIPMINLKAKRVLVTFLSVGLIFAFLSFEVYNRGHNHYVAPVYSAHNDDITYSTAESKIIFPKSFPVSNLRGFYDNKIRNLSTIEADKQPRIFKPHPTKIKPLTQEIMSEKYKHHDIKVYDGAKDIKEDLKQCSVELLKNLEIEITKDHFLKTEMEEIVQVLLKQMDEEPEMAELKDFFPNDVLRLHLKQDETKKHWLKFAGTSIWLDEYKVHLMLSRMLYLPIANDKRSQAVSLTYAQLYNEHWDELKDTEIIVPTNKIYNKENSNADGFESASVKPEDQVEYRLMKFPSFLSIPFYHNTKYLNGRWYGPEDPRVILIKNDFGYEEPLVIYNAHHRKIEKEEVENENDSKLKYKFYRSMFMAWPFQLQVGKENVDGFSNPRYDKNLYMRTVELRRSGVERLEVQKNWTPFIDTDDRVNHPYGGDKLIFFIYRWKNLEILKCDLPSVLDMASSMGGSSMCKFEYRQDENLKEDEPVGALRGGTQLIGLQDVIRESFHGEPNNKESEKRAEEQKIAFLNMIPKGKQIWIGFARAHIKGCCGGAMYRPNVAIITREDGRFKVAALSSYMSLDVTVFGWTDKAYKCENKDANVLIPNGIAAWRITSSKALLGSGKIEEVEDYLTLSLSVADETIQILHVKNLLNTLLQNTNMLKVVKTPAAYDSNKKAFLTQDQESIGFSNDVIICAMEESQKFCVEYKKQIDSEEKPAKDRQKLVDEQRKKLEEERKQADEKKAKEEQEKKEKEEKEKEAKKQADAEAKKQEDAKKKAEEIKKKLLEAQKAEGEKGDV